MRLLPRFSVAILLLVLSLAQAPSADGPDTWAYRRPQLPVVPEVRNPKVEIRNPVDAFLLARLGEKNLTYAPEADKRTLIRRVYFDLIGLPPTPEEVEAFVADKSPDAYEKLVDKLLASPQFGERMAIWWLDLVRFAETDGFKADDTRPQAWRYRDYVIQSFNADKPFDRSSRNNSRATNCIPIEPTLSSRPASCGTRPYEYNAVDVEQKRQDMLNDITDTTAAAFLGLTLGCCRCHDHKTDPIPQRDYYRFQAFFAGFWPVEKPLLAPAERAEYDHKLAAWEARRPSCARRWARSRNRFARRPRPRSGSGSRKNTSGCSTSRPTKRTPLQKQLGIAGRAAGLFAQQDHLGADEAGRPREVGRDVEADERVREGPPARAADRHEHDRCRPGLPADAIAQARQLAEPGQGGTRAGVPLGDRRPRRRSEADRDHHRPPRGARGVDGVEGQPADGSRDRQSALATPFREGHRRLVERLRRHRRPPDASGIARLAGRRVASERNGIGQPQAHSPSDRDLGRVSPVREGRRGRREGRSREHVALAIPATAARRRGAPRRDARRLGPVEREGRWAHRYSRRYRPNCRRPRARRGKRQRTRPSAIAAASTYS